MTHNLTGDLTREFDGRPCRKASASGAGNDCVFLPADGRLDMVADSKTGQTLAVPAAQLVALARR
jgi:hypothetical protein